MIYKHILFAVELDSALVSFQAKPSLIHIVQEQTRIHPGYF